MKEQEGLSSDTYVVLVARTSWENLPQLIGVGLLFSLCCAPAFLLFASGWLAPTVVVAVLTIAPAWTALLAYQQQLLQQRVVKFSTFGRALRTYGRRSVMLGGLGAFPLLATLITLPQVAQEAVPLVVWVGLAADFLGMAVMGALLLYAFPLLLYTDEGVRGLLRNALILASRHPFHTLGLLGMAILFSFAVAFFSVGLLFLLPTLFGMFVISNAELVMHET
ncbi:MAG: hypothetical protein KF832_06885 [Caldilineaceae bacterium]|nr:hypothetical protein [Caldilineaceae bacterium]